MRKLAFLSVAFVLAAVTFYGCDRDSPLAPAETAAIPVNSEAGTPLFGLTGQPSADGGAHVYNSGKGRSNIYCHYGSLVATKASAVITLTLA